jgi:hypothetical protein
MSRGFLEFFGRAWVVRGHGRGGGWWSGPSVVGPCGAVAVGRGGP